MLSLKFVLLLLALICFVLATLEVSAPRVNLTAAGLAFWILSVMVA